jgi:tau tubulin kinase
LNTNEKVTLKAESMEQERQLLKMEVTVLRRWQTMQQGNKFFCQLISGGHAENVNFLVTSLQGKHLAELLRAQNNQRFSLSTTLRLGLQILNIIKSFHSIGFIHRDIKPRNFSMGRLYNNSRVVYLHDCGLARKYTNAFSEEVRNPRQQTAFRGTIKYASVNAHKNKDLGRRDDLWSLLYVIVEFLTGGLPWSGIKDIDEVRYMKETFDHVQFLHYMPREFKTYIDHLKELKYESKPDYDLLRNVFLVAIQNLSIKETDSYDWEKEEETALQLEQMTI